MPNLIAPDKYTDMIKSALKYLIKTRSRKRKRYPLSKIFEVLYANFKIRNNKTVKNHVYEALKKMVASKELIENKKNSTTYYKLSDN